MSTEQQFLEENDAVKNQAGKYRYDSVDGVHMITLDIMLEDYKEWLIDMGLVKEL